MASKTAVNSFYGTGRRKTSSARVYLRQGTGKVSINGRTLAEFFGRETGRMIVQQPFGAVQLDGKFDVDAHVGRGSPVKPVRFATVLLARSWLTTRLQVAFAQGGFWSPAMRVRSNARRSAAARRVAARSSPNAKRVGISACCLPVQMSSARCSYRSLSDGVASTP